MKKQTTLILAILISSIYLAACGSNATSGTANNKASDQAMMSFGALAAEFKKSKEATRDKYKGKNLMVKGYALTAPTMPTGASDVGILTLSEKGGDMEYLLSCQFTAAEKAEFSRVTGSQTVTVTGVFDDDLAMRLKSCRVLNVE